MSSVSHVPQPQHRSRKPDGFTLIELVVVIILLGVLAAIALPRFVDLSQAARISSVKAMQGAIMAVSDNVHTACLLDSTCDVNNGMQYFYPNGRPALMVYGWLRGGGAVGPAVAGIDEWVVHEGFTAVAIDNDRTAFRLDGAPDPVNCAVTFEDVAVRGIGNGVGITNVTSGC